MNNSSKINVTNGYKYYLLISVKDIWENEKNF